MSLRPMIACALIALPSVAAADTAGVLLKCTVDRVEAYGGAFGQGVHLLEDPDFRISLTVTPDNLVYREHFAGTSKPFVTRYQRSITFENGILYKEREADAQSEFDRGKQFHRNEVVLPFSLDGFTSFQMVWMCYENGCSVHTQRIEASCGNAITIDEDTL